LTNLYKGRNVALENENGVPKITKDGVTVAKNVMLVSKANL
jgi:chaperonin GroEL (HSP60 family)